VKGDTLAEHDNYEESMSEHQIVLEAMSKARRVFNEVIGYHNLDPAYFQLSLIVDEMDGRLSSVLETVGWPSEVRDVRLVKKEREGE